MIKNTTLIICEQSLYNVRKHFKRPPQSPDINIIKIYILDYLKRKIRIHHVV